MAVYDKSPNVTKLHEAGLVHHDDLTANDVSVIDKLTSGEVDTMIQIARKVYGNDPGGMVKVHAGAGRLKIFLPL